MPLKAEFYQSRGKIARGVTNPVLAAKARLQTAFATGKVKVKRDFITPLPLLDKTVGQTKEQCKDKNDWFSFHFAFLL